MHIKSNKPDPCMCVSHNPIAGPCVGAYEARDKERARSTRVCTNMICVYYKYQIQIPGTLIDRRVVILANQLGLSLGYYRIFCSSLDTCPVMAVFRCRRCCCCCWFLTFFYSFNRTHPSALRTISSHEFSATLYRIGLSMVLSACVRSCQNLSERNYSSIVY